IIGHSLGEYAAAYEAGVFTFSEMLQVVAERGRLMDTLPRGSMVGVHAPLIELEPLIADGKLEIACRNSPDLTVLGGSEEEVKSFVDTCDRRGFQWQQLAVDQAFHTRLVEPILAEFSEYLDRVDPRPAKLDWISSVTATSMLDLNVSAEYWVHHLRNQVE